MTRSLIIPVSGFTQHVQLHPTSNIRVCHSSFISVTVFNHNIQSIRLETNEHNCQDKYVVLEFDQQWTPTNLAAVHFTRIIAPKTETEGRVIHIYLSLDYLRISIQNWSNASVNDFTKNTHKATLCYCLGSKNTHQKIRDLTGSRHFRSTTTKHGVFYFLCTAFIFHGRFSGDSSYF
jgi:hypothetical protein